MSVTVITVADQVWIAAMSFIAPGVTIGTGAVIAAGSVVFKDVPAGAVMRGNPAVSESRTENLVT